MHQHRPMGTSPNRLSVLDASTSARQPSSSAQCTGSATHETEIKPTSRYVLPSDLDAAIKYLDDQQLDKLVSAALEERKRRRGPAAPDKNQRYAEVDCSSLPQGKLTA